MAGFDHISGEHLEIDGAKIYYELQGNPDGHLMLLLHGGFGTIEDFNSIVDSLSGDYRLLAIDSRGHGRSTLGSTELVYSQLQHDVTTILQHLQISTLSIIGFSDGGIVAYRLAALGNFVIEKLVTISSRWKLQDALLTERMFLKMTPESYRNEHPEVYNVYQRLNPEPDFTRFTDVLIKMWLDGGPTGYLNEKISAIHCPLLIVHGDDDDLLTKRSVVELSEMIEGSHLFNIPFSKHFVFKEQSEIFRIGLGQFLKKT